MKKRVKKKKVVSSFSPKHLIFTINKDQEMPQKKKSTVDGPYKKYGLLNGHLKLFHQHARTCVSRFHLKCTKLSEFQMNIFSESFGQKLLLQNILLLCFA
ncbi:unnamed protein product [Ilex paraguariensis]|uniref:Uncharacterized protein n=1 Tax=Ilex paraguariensis TaxID=185542 RepID=A0ABC8UC79_9AQUA